MPRPFLPHRCLGVFWFPRFLSPSSLTGGWNMTSSLRLDGPKVDKELLAFIAGRSDNNLTAAEALEKSLISSSVLGFRWIPAVDPKTGMFSSYTIISEQVGALRRVRRHAAHL